MTFLIYDITEQHITMNGPHVKFAYDVLISLRECSGNSYVFGDSISISMLLVREVRKGSSLLTPLSLSRVY